MKFISDVMTVFHSACFPISAVTSDCIQPCSYAKPFAVKPNASENLSTSKRPPPPNNADIVRHVTTFSIRFPAVHLHFYPPLLLPALVRVVQYKGTAACQNDNSSDAVRTLRVYMAVCGRMRLRRIWKPMGIV